MKYVIEFEDKPIIKNDGRKLYAAKGFNALMFDEHGLGNLEKYSTEPLINACKEAFDKGRKEGHKSGMKDAWVLAYHLFHKMTISKAEELLGTEFKNMTEVDPEEVLARFLKSEMNGEIQIGDEVTTSSSAFYGRHAKMVVTCIEKNDGGEVLISGFGFDSMGNKGSFLSRNAKHWEKTGKHYDDIEVIYGKIRTEKK